MTLVVGSFAAGFRGVHRQVGDATAQVFQKAMSERSRKKRCCDVVCAMVRRAQFMPEKEEECIRFLIEAVKECGIKSVIEAMTNFGIKHPETKDLCVRFTAEICHAS